MNGRNSIPRGQNESIANFVAWLNLHEILRPTCADPLHVGIARKARTLGQEFLGAAIIVPIDTRAPLGKIITEVGFNTALLTARASTSGAWTGLFL